MIDEILNKLGLKYEELVEEEKQTLNTWLSAIQQGGISVEKIRDYLHAMKDAVEAELTKTGLDKETDIYLKARLKNYMLLEAFLSTPEKAKKQIELYLSGLAGKG